jgi:hypothetical protein
MINLHTNKPNHYHYETRKLIQQQHFINTQAGQWALQSTSPLYKSGLLSHINLPDINHYKIPGHKTLQSNHYGNPRHPTNPNPLNQPLHFTKRLQSPRGTL